MTLKKGSEGAGFRLSRFLLAIGIFILLVLATLILVVVVPLGTGIRPSLPDSAAPPYAARGLYEVGTRGFVYCGARIGSLYGTYIYANLCGGQIYGLKRDQEGQWLNLPLLDGQGNIATFGKDHLGELYYGAIDTGNIYRLQAGHQHFLPVVQH